MKLVLEEKGNAVLQNGMPVYEYEDGQKMPFDAKGTLEGLNNKITAESEKAKRFYDDREKLAGKLKPFEGLDPEDVKKALELKKNLSDKSLIDANGVEELKRQMKIGFEDEKTAIAKSYETKIEGIGKEKQDLESIIFDLAVMNQFATSEYFAGEKPKTIYSPEDAKDIFGKRFRVEMDGAKYRVVALDEKNKPMMSKKNHGELADFNEAITLMVEAKNKSHNIMAGASGRGPRSTHNFDNDNRDPNTLSNQDLIKRGLEKRQRMR